MENIFIILAIIASVVYKFYENYKKEMEEAAKRKQKARRVPPTVENDTFPPSPTPRPIPPRPKIQLPPRPAIPIPEIRQPTPRKTVRPTSKSRTEPVIPTEMTQVHQLYTKREQSQILEIIADTEDGATQGIHQTEIEFDLKTAIIQSTILERPYQ